MSELREIARLRWRENAQRQIQVTRRRRFIGAFLFGIVLTVTVAMLMLIAVDDLLGTSVHRIEQELARPQN